MKSNAVKNSTSNSIETIRDIVCQHATNRAEHLAFISLRSSNSEEVSLTYAQLDNSCQRIAAALQRHEIFGQRVILLLPQGIEFISGFLGILYAGAIAVPACIPRNNKRSWMNFESIIADCTPKVILTCRFVLNKILSCSSDSSAIHAIKFICIEDLNEDTTLNWTPPKVIDSDIAFLQYTSGSTSSPKGVMVSHRNLLHNARFVALNMKHDPSTVIVSWLPLFHDLGLIGIVVQTVFIGATCYMMSPATFSVNPALWLQAISKYRATTSMSSDFGYSLCVNMVRDEQLVNLDLSHWKNALNAAEPIHASTLHSFSVRFRHLGFSDTAFCPAYGMAEATLLITMARYNEQPVLLTVDRLALSQGKLIPLTEHTDGSIEIVSSGRPSDDTDVRIVDPESLELCPDGVMGEVWAEGPSITQGYWNKFKETLDNFNQNIKSIGRTGYLRTGDLGILWNGELFITGRLKDLIIHQGRNIYPQDIEQTVRNCNQAFRVVNGVAFSIEQNEGEDLIIVHEVDRIFRNNVDVEELKKLIREAIWSDHKIPVADIVLIDRALLPKTTSGKVQRQSTKQAYLKGELIPISNINMKK